MKTKEEILIKFGCPDIPFDENVTMYYPAILSAMDEYANQQVEFAQRWIPVEEGLPKRIEDQKYSEKVLVKSIDLESGEELQIYLDWFDFVEDLFKEEITFQGFMKVTHWRPIEYK